MRISFLFLTRSFFFCFFFPAAARPVVYNKFPRSRRIFFCCCFSARCGRAVVVIAGKRRGQLSLFERIYLLFCVHAVYGMWKRTAARLWTTKTETLAGGRRRGWCEGENEKNKERRGKRKKAAWQDCHSLPSAGQSAFSNFPGDDVHKQFPRLPPPSSTSLQQCIPIGTRLPSPSLPPVICGWREQVAPGFNVTCNGAKKKKKKKYTHIYMYIYLYIHTCIRKNNPVDRCVTAAKTTGHTARPPLLVYDNVYGSPPVTEPFPRNENVCIIIFGRSIIHILLLCCIVAKRKTENGFPT